MSAEHCFTSLRYACAKMFHDLACIQSLARTFTFHSHSHRSCIAYLTIFKPSTACFSTFSSASEHFSSLDVHMLLIFGTIALFCSKRCCAKNHIAFYATCNILYISNHSLEHSPIHAHCSS